MNITCRPLIWARHQKTITMCFLCCRNTPKTTHQIFYTLTRFGTLKQLRFLLRNVAEDTENYNNIKLKKKKTKCSLLSHVITKSSAHVQSGKYYFLINVAKQLSSVLICRFLNIFLVSIYTFLKLLTEDFTELWKTVFKIKTTNNMLPISRFRCISRDTSE